MKTRDSKNLLIVDDEPEIRELLASVLEREGFHVTAIDRGREAVRAAAQRAYDAVLLDINLPDISGLEVFKRIREFSQVPVLMITGRSDHADRVAGLELGADDYITKPFDAREVVARVKTVIRRSHAVAKAHANSKVRIFGRLVVDIEALQVRLDGNVVNVTPTEFRIIATLSERPGIVFSREQLIERVSSNGEGIFDRTLDRHIANLRAKLGDSRANSRIIGTVHGFGYRLIS